MESNLIPIHQRHVSWSQLWQQQQCEWRWALKNIQRVSSLRRYRAPSAGSAIHEGVAAALKGQGISKAVQAWADEEVRQMQFWIDTGYFGLDDDIDMVEDLVMPTIEIVDRFIGWLEPDKWDTILHPETADPVIETAFMCELPPFAGFLGIIDWCATERETGLTWVIDWKTRVQMIPPEAEETNLQKCSYQWLLGKNGIQTDGSKICQIWRDPMKTPKTNQNGSLSRAAIRTTWEVYRSEIERKELDVMDYTDMMEKCNPIEDFYRWSTSHRSPQEVHNTWWEVVVPRAERIAEMCFNAESEVERYPAPKRALGSAECPRCWARDTCLELLRGRDLEDAMMSSGLIKKPYTPLLPSEQPPDEAFEMEGESK